jgi:iron complex transport system ATP-binding protein
LGFEHLADEWLRVSGGERQLALVARLSPMNRGSRSSTNRQRASILGNQVRVLNAARGLAETHGLSVLLSTHNPEQAFACADRVAVLAGGRLLRIGTPVDVITPETLQTCYAVDVAVLPVADDRYRVCVPRSYLLC